MRKFAIAVLAVCALLLGGCFHEETTTDPQPQPEDPVVTPVDPTPVEPGGPADPADVTPDPVDPEESLSPVCSERTEDNCEADTNCGWSGETEECSPVE
jgi:hypothetical protein